MTCCTEGRPCPNRPVPNTHNGIKYLGLVTSLMGKGNGREGRKSEVEPRRRRRNTPGVGWTGNQPRMLDQHSGLVTSLGVGARVDIWDHLG